MVTETSGHANRSQQSGPLSLPINHWELEIRLLNDLVGPPRHVGVSIQHSAANVSSERMGREEEDDFYYLQRTLLVVSHILTKCTLLQAVEEPAGPRSEVLLSL